jgi:hypothetical protein
MDFLGGEIALSDLQRRYSLDVKGKMHAKVLSEVADVLFGKARAQRREQEAVLITHDEDGGPSLQFLSHSDISVSQRCMYMLEMSAMCGVGLFSSDFASVLAVTHSFEVLTIQCVCLQLVDASSSLVRSFAKVALGIFHHDVRQLPSGSF